jgi:DNA-binding NarL/FixJ family response regulator
MIHGEAEMTIAGAGSWFARMGVTPHEQRVVKLLERGLTNPEIAGVLGVSAHTVRNQVASVFRKLHVSRRAELVYIVSHESSQDAAGET